MADVMTMPDGRQAVLMGMQDFYWLVDEYMGPDMRRWLEGCISETYGGDGEIDAVIEECEKELDTVRGKYCQALDEIRAEAGKLAGLIREKDIDRSEVSRTAGRIGSLSCGRV